MAPPAPGTAPVSIVWFRKCLRLHDNPALLTAAKGAAAVLPVFCLDPWFLNPDKVGTNRLAFLLEALQDLNDSLVARGSRLIVLRGNPLEVLPYLWREHGVTKLCFEADTEGYARVRDAQVVELAKQAGLEVYSPVSHTLYDTAQILKKNNGSPPLTYKAFERVAASLGPPVQPVEDPPAKLPPPLPFFDKGGGSSAAHAVPRLVDLGYLHEPTTSFHGGETVALARMAEQLSDKEWVAAFEKPKTNPAAFLRPATTVLSPYLKFGCLSARLFYASIARILKEKKQHSKPPVSLVGQLLWREFFYTAAAYVPNFERILGNPICKQVPWDDNEEFYQAWDEGRTGYPWIDAIMRQLHEQGWMHHLARHSVIVAAQVLGSMFKTPMAIGYVTAMRWVIPVSWERGRDTFDRLLIDADPSINTANWMWLSASSFFYQYFRVYSPITFGKKYDKEGLYVRRFLPVLKDMPAKYVYEPWTAPLEVQKAANCIIGKDYPAPIVDHASIHKVNIQRIRQAYEQHPEPGMKRGAAEQATGVSHTSGDQGSSKKLQQEKYTTL